jgi:hypothetical protein
MAKLNRLRARQAAGRRDAPLVFGRDIRTKALLWFAASRNLAIPHFSYLHYTFTLDHTFTFPISISYKRLESRILRSDHGLASGTLHQSRPFGTLATSLKVKVSSHWRETTFNRATCSWWKMHYLEMQPSSPEIYFCIAFRVALLLHCPTHFC